MPKSQKDKDFDPNKIKEVGDEDPVLGNDWDRYLLNFADMTDEYKKKELKRLLRATMDLAEKLPKGFAINIHPDLALLYRPDYDGRKNCEPGGSNKAQIRNRAKDEFRRTLQEYEAQHLALLQGIRSARAGPANNNRALVPLPGSTASATPAPPPGVNSPFPFTPGPASQSHQDNLSASGRSSISQQNHEFTLRLFENIQASAARRDAIAAQREQTATARELARQQAEQNRAREEANRNAAEERRAQEDRENLQYLLSAYYAGQVPPVGATPRNLGAAFAAVQHNGNSNSTPNLGNGNSAPPQTPLASSLALGQNGSNAHNGMAFPGGPGGSMATSIPAAGAANTTNAAAASGVQAASNATSHQAAAANVAVAGGGGSAPHTAAANHNATNAAAAIGGVSAPHAAAGLSVTVNTTNVAVAGGGVSAPHAAAATNGTNVAASSPVSGAPHQAAAATAGQVSAPPHAAAAAGVSVSGSIVATIHQADGNLGAALGEQNGAIQTASSHTSSPTNIATPAVVLNPAQQRDLARAHLLLGDPHNVLTLFIHFLHGTSSRRRGRGTLWHQLQGLDLPEEYSVARQVEAAFATMLSEMTEIDIESHIRDWAQGSSGRPILQDVALRSLLNEVRRRDFEDSTMLIAMGGGIAHMERSGQSLNGRDEFLRFVRAAADFATSGAQDNAPSSNQPQKKAEEKDDSKKEEKVAAKPPPPSSTDQGAVMTTASAASGAAVVATPAGQAQVPAPSQQTPALDGPYREEPETPETPPPTPNEAPTSTTTPLLRGGSSSAPNGGALQSPVTLLSDALVALSLKDPNDDVSADPESVAPMSPDDVISQLAFGAVPHAPDADTETNRPGEGPPEANASSADGSNGAGPGLAVEAVSHAPDADTETNRPGEGPPEANASATDGSNGAGPGLAVEGVSHVPDGDNETNGAAGPGEGPPAATTDPVGSNGAGPNVAATAELATTDSGSHETETPQVENGSPEPTEEAEAIDSVDLFGSSIEPGQVPYLGTNQSPAAAAASTTNQQRVTQVLALLNLDNAVIAKPPAK